jgi:CheY-like chemotaxis protein
MRRILAVTAEDSLLHALSAMLASHFDFTTRHNAREALACYEIEKPDLVLVDYHLPDSDGLWLIRAVHWLGGPCVPAVIMADADEQEQLASDADVSAVLAKPFNAGQLLGLLEAVSRLGPRLLPHPAPHRLRQRETAVAVP